MSCLDNITKDDIRCMDYDRTLELVEAVNQEKQMAEWKRALINLIDVKEAVDKEVKIVEA